MERLRRHGHAREERLKARGVPPPPPRAVLLERQAHALERLLTRAEGRSANPHGYAKKSGRGERVVSRASPLHPSREAGRGPSDADVLMETLRRRCVLLAFEACFRHATRPLHALTELKTARQDALDVLTTEVRDAAGWWPAAG